MRGGGRTAKRMRRREPGKVVAVWSSIPQRAWAACVRCGELSGAKVDMQLAIADADVACSGEQLMQQGSPLLVGTGVVGSQQRKKIALGLIGNHLDDVGQVLAFRGELDDGPLVEISDFDALGNVAALLEQLRHASTGCAQLLAEPAMGDLEAPHD